MVSIDAGKYIVDNMPNTKWVELPGADHIYFVNSSEILFAVTEFIKTIPDTSHIETCIATILHARLAYDILPSQNLRSEIKEFQAKYISIDGRDMIATFDSPTRAIKCATGLRNIIKLGNIKVSLHVGECHLNDGRPTAVTSKLSIKATELAPDREILITQTLHDILAGSSLSLEQQPIPVDSQTQENAFIYLLT